MLSTNSTQTSTTHGPHSLQEQLVSLLQTVKQLQKEKRRIREQIQTELLQKQKMLENLQNTTERKQSFTAQVEQPLVDLRLDTAQIQQEIIALEERLQSQYEVAEQLESLEATHKRMACAQQTEKNKLILAEGLQLFRDCMDFYSPDTFRQSSASDAGNDRQTETPPKNKSYIEKLRQKILESQQILEKIKEIKAATPELREQTQRIVAKLRDHIAHIQQEIKITRQAADKIRKELYEVEEQQTLENMDAFDAITTKLLQSLQEKRLIVSELNDGIKKTEATIKENEAFWTADDENFLQDLTPEAAKIKLEKKALQVQELLKKLTTMVEQWEATKAARANNSIGRPMQDTPEMLSYFRHTNISNTAPVGANAIATRAPSLRSPIPNP